MATNIDDIYQAIAELCETEGLHIYEEMPEASSLVLPAVVLGWPDNIQYNMGMGPNSCEVTFTALVLAPTASLSAAQRTMNELLSTPDGLVDKIQASPTTQPWKGISVSEATVVGTDVFDQTNQRYLLANLLIIVNT